MFGILYINQALTIHENKNLLLVFDELPRIFRYSKALGIIITIYVIELEDLHVTQ